MEINRYKQENELRSLGLMLERATSEAALKIDAIPAEVSAGEERDLIEAANSVPRHD